MRIEKKIIFAVTGLLFAFVMSLLLFYAEKLHVYTIRALPCSNLRILFAGLLLNIILITIIYKLRKKTELILERTAKWIVPAIVIILLVYEMIFTYSSYFYTDWDPAGLIDAAEKIARGNTEDISIGYISAHPNNRFLIWIYLIIFKITIFFTGNCQIMSIIWIQCLLTSLTCFLIYRLLRKLGNSRTFSFCVFMAASIYIGMSPWLNVPYSDEAVLILPLYLLYLYIKRTDMFSWIIIGLLTAVGYAIKPQVVLMTIAMIAYSVLQRLCGVRKRGKEGSFECAAGFLAAIFIFLLVLNGTILPSLNLNLDVTKEFGISHYFMMGLNHDTDGVYSNEDTEYTASFENKHARNSADIDLAKRRIRDYGAAGTVRHFIRKLIVNYGDGSFAWGINGNFFAGRPEGMNTIFTDFFTDIIYDSGSRFKDGLMLAQGIWLQILLGSMLVFIKIFSKEKESEKDHSDAMAIISLSLIGITAFEQTFEALSRYLFIYSPLFLLLAADGCRSEVRLIRTVSEQLQRLRSVPGSE